MEFVVYKIINNINGCIYIGITNNFERRMREHKNNAENLNYKYKSKLYNAMRKYGIENFSSEIIETVKSRKQLEEREKHWIKFYNSTDHELGYNITDGGTGGCTHDVSGENNPMYGHKYTDAEKKKIGDYTRGIKRSEKTKKKISCGLKGVPKTEIHKKHLSCALKGNIPINSKEIKVINIYTQEILIFPSEASMERELHCSRKTIKKGKITKSGYMLLDYFKNKSVETIENITQEKNLCEEVSRVE